MDTKHDEPAACAPGKKVVVLTNSPIRWKVEPTTRGNHQAKLCYQSQTVKIFCSEEPVAEAALDAMHNLMGWKGRYHVDADGQLDPAVIEQLLADRLLTPSSPVMSPEEATKQAKLTVAKMMREVKDRMAPLLLMKRHIERCVPGKVRADRYTTDDGFADHAQLRASDIRRKSPRQIHVHSSRGCRHRLYSMSLPNETDEHDYSQQYQHQLTSHTKRTSQPTASDKQPSGKRSRQTEDYVLVLRFPDALPAEIVSTTYTNAPQTGADQQQQQHQQQTYNPTALADINPAQAKIIECTRALLHVPFLGRGAVADVEHLQRFLATHEQPITLLQQFLVAAPAGGSCALRKVAKVLQVDGPPTRRAVMFVDGASCSPEDLQNSTHDNVLASASASEVHFASSLYSVDEFQQLCLLRLRIKGAMHTLQALDRFKQENADYQSATPEAQRSVQRNIAFSIWATLRQQATSSELLKVCELLSQCTQGVCPAEF